MEACPYAVGLCFYRMALVLLPGRLVLVRGLYSPSLISVGFVWVSLGVCLCCGFLFVLAMGVTFLGSGSIVFVLGDCALV